MFITGVCVSNMLELQRRIADQIGMEANLLLEAQGNTRIVCSYNSIFSD